jgi:hypothetical protein
VSGAGHEIAHRRAQVQQECKGGCQITWKGVQEPNSKLVKYTDSEVRRQKYTISACQALMASLFPRLQHSPIYCAAQADKSEVNTKAASVYETIEG